MPIFFQGGQNRGPADAVHLRERPRVSERALGPPGHANVLQAGESFCSWNTQIGERRAQAVSRQCSGEQQARKDTGIFYKNVSRTAGAFGVEGMVRYGFRHTAIKHAYTTIKLLLKFPFVFLFFIFIQYISHSALPFVKNPEDNPTYSVHFSRQWQDTMLVSLHNFLSTIFQVGDEKSNDGKCKNYHEFCREN